MARKRAPKVAAIQEEPVQTQVPIRFEMPAEEYQELSRQARKLGLSKASYAKMLVMKAVAAEKEGAK